MEYEIIGNGEIKLSRFEMKMRSGALKALVKAKE
jgi:hypothetical protein